MFKRRCMEFSKYKKIFFSLSMYFKLFLKNYIFCSYKRLTIKLKFKSAVEMSFVYPSNKIKKNNFLNIIIFDFLAKEDVYKIYRPYGCNYEISEDGIWARLELYGEVRSEIEEIATQDKEGERLFGTGSYIVKIKLNRLIPHIIPVHGLMVKCTYSGVKTQCRNCYGYHPAKMTEERSQKKTNTCEKKTFDQYIAEYVNMIDYWDGDDESEGEADDKEDAIDYNFYYDTKLELISNEQVGAVVV